MIDCDVHNDVTKVNVLFPYLSAYWRETIEQSGFKGPVDTPYAAHADSAKRPAASASVEALRADVLDTPRAEFAILNCTYAIDSIHNPYAAAALASAVNDWQSEHWLAAEARLRASLVVPSQFPDLALKEIERCGARSGFVQVLLPAHSAAPYGNRRYWPIYEAAAQRGWVIGIHFGGAPGNPPTASGWPSYYIEDYVNAATNFQSQVISLIAEGVFAQFPNLRVTLIEGGFTWLPALLWRMDKEWKGLRREVPWLKRLPSDEIRAHVRLTTQPLDAPQPEQLLDVIRQLECDELLLYASDYPHWHDGGESAFPIELPEPLRSKIMGENARAWYNWNR